jgi:hypothetical protein
MGADGREAISVCADETPVGKLVVPPGRYWPGGVAKRTVAVVLMAALAGCEGAAVGTV